MSKVKENYLAVKGEQLPQYLASLGLAPYQITTAIYGLFREVKLLGNLTPQEDNAIHIDKEKILKMANNPILESGIYSLFLKVQRNKSWEALFQKESKHSELTAPDLWHNPQGCSPKLPANAPTEEDVEIVDFTKFLSYCGISPDLAKKAMEEMLLMKGEQSNEEENQ